MKLEIPKSLESLMESGKWPEKGSSTTLQELSPLVSIELSEKVISGEKKVILFPPPFHTIKAEITDGNTFWTSSLVGNDVGLDYSKSLIIADFGIGSDTAIILNYANESEPDVFCLEYSGNGDSFKARWVRTHDTFESFAAAIGLLE